MQKTILLTGATDGIGLETAHRLAKLGHTLLLHGRNETKLATVKQSLIALEGGGEIMSYKADLSLLEDVEKMAQTLIEQEKPIDVIINNAGVFNTPKPTLENGLDIRFVVNTIAPYLLVKRLLPQMKKDGRIINLSSAAQAPVNVDALLGRVQLPNDFAAYAQSKLAITMWSHYLSTQLPDGPMIVAINPGSMLGTKMVKNAFGVAGKDIGIGADILVRATVSDEFANASGKYFDNDSGRFAPPHADGVDVQKSAEVIHAIEHILASL